MKNVTKQQHIKLHVSLFFYSLKAIQDNLCVSTGETFICYTTNVNSRKLFPESLNFVTTQVKPPYSITCRQPTIKSELKSLLCSGSEESINSEAIASLVFPFYPGLFCSSSWAHSLHGPTTAKGGDAVSHTCPRRDNSYTTHAPLGCSSFSGVMQVDPRVDLQTDTSRKYQFSFFQLSLQTLWNPSNSTSDYHFSAAILPLCSPDTKLLACKLFQSLKEIRKSTNLTNILFLLIKPEQIKTELLWAKWVLIW